MSCLLWYLVILIGALALTYIRIPLWGWMVATGLAFLTTFKASSAPGLLTFILLLGFAASIFLSIPGMRRSFISDKVLVWFRKALPPMSQTEKEALDAGTVWWDGDLFSGDPDWNKWLNYAPATLTEEEKAFLDGPTNELCKMLDDWDITHNRADLPPEVWKFIKEQGFLGMIIPKEYGGKDFSAYAHSCVVMKLATRSATAAVTVMVPNSLGPAELLMKYGTDEQKNHFLPRLATGEEVPCFALTGPDAGSDAGSIPDKAIVCKGQWEGKEVIGLKVTWEKRYITLGPVSTILGLAFKVYDPEHLLSDVEERGISCALIPSNHPGVNIGRRHFPLNSAFMNGPNSGDEVFIPMNFLIGGEARIGEGWKMLVSCLSVGRAISLPSLGVAGGKMAALTAGAYARVRKQFKVPIGKFEGVEEPLARIGGLAYMMDAARKVTTSSLDMGEKPSVLGAICKFHLTEYNRTCLNDSMDIHGGRGICMGPSNYLARFYQVIPVSITVEGANILTRTLIIFGQGAMRCHPYVLKEIEAANNPNESAGAEKFDQLLFEHIGYTITNAVRAFVHAVTGSRFAKAPNNGPAKKYFQQLSRMSAAFTFVTDVALLTLGGALKRKEKLSGRLGDVLSHLYLASCTLKRFEDEGRQLSDLPLVEWAVKHNLSEMQKAFDDALRNFPMCWLGCALRWIIFPLGRSYNPPSDKLGHKVASLLLEPSLTRDRLVDGVFYSDDPQDPVGRVEYGLQQVLAAEPIEKRIQQAVRDKQLTVGALDNVAQAALDAGIITADEKQQLDTTAAAVRAVIMVDDFDGAELARS